MDETDGLLQQNSQMTHPDHDTLQQLSPYLDAKRQELTTTLAALKKDRQLDAIHVRLDEINNKLDNKKYN